MSAPLANSERAGEEPPPFLGSWTRHYVVVIAALVAEIVLLAMLSRIGR